MRYLRAISAVLALGLALAIASCSDDSPTSSSSVATTIESVELAFGGVAWTGGPIQGDLGPTLFTIRLRDRDQLHLRSVSSCHVSFDRPGMGAGGPRHTGTRLCHDDGTNGDPTPGDGICNYFDQDDTMGCARAGMPAGQYQYRFECQFSDGSTSQMTLQVSRL